MCKETQIRRDQSRCRRRIQALIEKARACGDEQEASIQELRLARLENRWALGLNSRSRLVKSRGLAAYFVK